MRNTNTSTITQPMIDRAEKIEIVSGEGENGTRGLYTGKRTVAAIQRHLTKERSSGDRWAVLIIDDQRI